MKKILLITLVLMVVLVACGPADESCALAWKSMDVDPGDETLTTNLILNNNWPPDSVGHIVKECIESGWDGWR